MASGDLEPELGRLHSLLEKADLTSFFYPLRSYGVLKVEHLSDMGDADYEQVGMSALEKKRLLRFLEKETRTSRLQSISAVAWKVSSA